MTRGSHWRFDLFARLIDAMKQHDTQIRVRYVETDAMGFLHHSRYLAYFEIGRTELFRAQGGNYREMEESGLFLVIARVECRYLNPARYDDVLTLRTTISRITPAKLEHDYELFRGDELLTTAHTLLACVDREGVIQRMPDFVIATSD
jgi:acyl-CoA thioester hydrolase